MASEENVLIKYRIGRAEETLDEVKLAVENNKLHLAANRIYAASAQPARRIAWMNRLHSPKILRLRY